MSEPAFNSAQRVASLQRHLGAMVEEFDGMLTQLIRDGLVADVTNERVLRDKEGQGGIVLRIEARRAGEAELAAVLARQGGAS